MRHTTFYNPTRPRARHGMTAIELSIGLVITTLVFGAMSAVWYAVAETWSRGSSSQNVALTGTQTVARLEATFRVAKYLIQFTPGSADGTATPAASAMYWKGDNWKGLTDYAVEIGEIAMIEHDAAAKCVYLYEALPLTSMTASQDARASGVATWTDLGSASFPATFKAYDFVKKTTFAQSIAGAAFNVPTGKAGSRAMIEFTLKPSRADGRVLMYGAATLRAPTTRPL